MRLTSALLPVLILVPLAGQAQTDAALTRQYYLPSGESRVVIGVGGAISQPLGEFAHSVNDGFGADFHFAWRFGESGAVALRIEGVTIRYGEETKTVTGRVPGEITTGNGIYWMTIGPQFMVTHGPVRPYVNAGLGLADFNTSSSFKAKNQDEASSEVDNFDKKKISLAAGVGTTVSLFQRNGVSAALDVGARYHQVGRAQYLRQGAIDDLPDGSISVNPTTSTANFITYHVGLMIGWFR